MSLCAHRPEPGATSCYITYTPDTDGDTGSRTYPPPSRGSGCQCAAEVRAELKAAEGAAGLRPNDNGGRAT